RLSLVCLFLVALFFFFQAEDGIRDRNVTGVQTCALPISIRSVARASAVSTVIGSRNHVGPCSALAGASDWPSARKIASSRPRSRSEERRVGKECSTRRAA